jgi:YD repeat-containing protein
VPIGRGTYYYHADGLGSITELTKSNGSAVDSYTYAAFGDLTADGTGVGTHTYQWDGEGRLNSVDNGSTWTFTYNALGERVKSHYGTDMNYNWWEYIYDAAGEVVGTTNRVAWQQRMFPLGGREPKRWTAVTVWPEPLRCGHEGGR